MKKPWNIPDLPVYSLMTEINGRVNMNICTYVSAMSMSPKRYAVGVYYQTKTLENIQNGSSMVLQLLHESQYAVVRNFGLKSGITKDKHEFLRKKNSGDVSHPHKAPYECVQWNDHVVLKHAVAYLELKPVWNQSAGDHELYMCEVNRYQANHSDGVLSLRLLGEKGIIRI